MNEGELQRDDVKTGETTMAFEGQDSDPLREVYQFKKGVGGVQGDIAIGLSRLGFDCRWKSGLGADE